MLLVSLYLANMNLTELPTGVFDWYCSLYLEKHEFDWAVWNNLTLRTLPAGSFFGHLRSLRYLYFLGGIAQQSLGVKPCGSDISQHLKVWAGLRRVPDVVFWNFGRCWMISCLSWVKELRNGVEKWFWGFSSHLEGSGSVLNVTSQRIAQLPLRRDGAVFDRFSILGGLCIYVQQFNLYDLCVWEHFQKVHYFFGISAQQYAPDLIWAGTKDPLQTSFAGLQLTPCGQLGTSWEHFQKVFFGISWNIWTKFTCRQQIENTSRRSFSEQ